jgi:hypothetical protein
MARYCCNEYKTVMSNRRNCPSLSQAVGPPVVERDARSYLESPFLVYLDDETEVYDVFVTIFSEILI